MEKNLWAYCSGAWLEFKQDPQKHYTRRKTSKWWVPVQKGYSDQVVMPAVRCKAFAAVEKQLFDQVYGMMTSIKALGLEKLKVNGAKYRFIDSLKDLVDMAGIFGKEDDEFQAAIEVKRAKYQRILEKIPGIQFNRSEMMAA